ncbi:MAG TPA: CoA pyrophosphatase [Anaerolineales bacterium]|nr:CoA pyrophosphatase [Anaerolineales bacterium]
MNANALTPDAIQTVLAAQTYTPVKVPKIIKAFSRRKTREAAVLIPMVWQENGWHILFIRRTELDGDMHSGQVALPGGGWEDGDANLVETALRESQEELAIRPEDVQVLGRLGEQFAISNRRVVPVVGTMPWPYPLVRQEREVARWFTIPLNWLADPANRTTKERKLPLGVAKFEVIYFDEYDGEVLWGLSARIILDFLEILNISKGE